jgi:tRNA pseudouridine55 synthase
MSFDGILLVNKPKDWSSFDVVAKIRGTLKRETGQKIKVGHTGTLDPQATGLLVIVVGSYCKRASEFSKLDKTYSVTMKLGETSTTGDAEGEKQVINNSTQPSLNELETILSDFIGDSLQTPPIYSAIKINGQRAYKMARKGQEVVIEPRPIRINSIKLTNYSYPFVEFTTDVSSGTYIRSLVEDIGKQLQTGAYMSDLQRTRVGQFDIVNATSDLNNIDLESIKPL